MTCAVYRPTETDLPEHERIEGLGNLTNGWIGLKNIVYNILQNGTSYPKMEMRFDQNNSNLWKKVHEYIDGGSWGSTLNRYEDASDQTYYLGLISCHF
jgi:hypothetical protein